MTAPDTNLSKQKRRHRGPLVAFALCAVVVVGLLAIFSTLSPESETVLIEGATPTPQEN